MYESSCESEVNSCYCEELDTDSSKEEIFEIAKVDHHTHPPFRD